ncbi:MAG: rhodanese-like domain-containing protein [Candidatus Moranbacteria bacterium]|nr:rhodanese-like domain-containing protein [Candidatus Moranbacteria bacterium]
MREISVRELQEILAKKDEDVVVIDVRTKAEYEEKHIAGVSHAPLDEIERYVEVFKKYKTVYVCCQSGNRSMQACVKLASLGLSDIVNVRGGLLAWEEEKRGACEGKRCGISLLRQTWLAAGFLILCGFLFFWLFHPYFLVIPFLVGCGLVGAGVTGKCFMMTWLLRMSWNKRVS